MTWIKDHQFPIALASITSVGVAVFAVIGLQASSRYSDAKDSFDAAASEAAGFERLPLYPNQANRDGKRKAVEDYKATIEEIQQAFEKFRPEQLESLSPQAFTNRLKELNDELIKAFADSNTEVPEEFFSGFEVYRTSLPNGNATGILKFQLDALRNILLSMAQSGPSKLVNLHRPQLAEEKGNPWQAADGQLARTLPLEIALTGTESSLRQFISALAKPQGTLAVIRTLRISNTNPKPPMASDAKFADKPSSVSGPASQEFPEMSDIFVQLEGDSEEEDSAETNAEPDAAPPAPPIEPADSGRILSQVLGNEEVHAFIRLDLVLPLPPQNLP
ncbi:MAG: Amuc_1100 family pilus-like protein [Luteolibacter sp.]